MKGVGRREQHVRRFRPVAVEKFMLATQHVEQFFSGAAGDGGVALSGQDQGRNNNLLQLPAQLPDQAVDL